MINSVDSINCSTKQKDLKHVSCKSNFGTTPNYPADSFESQNKKRSALGYLFRITGMAALAFGAICFVKGKGVDGAKKTFGERMKDGFKEIFGKNKKTLEHTERTAERDVETSVKDAEKYLQEEEKSILEYKKASDARNEEWLKQQHKIKEAEYSKIWEKGLAEKEAEKYLQEEEKSILEYKNASDARNEEWLKQQHKIKEAEYSKIWEKGLAQKEAKVKKNSILTKIENWVGDLKKERAAKRSERHKIRELQKTKKNATQKEKHPFRNRINKWFESIKDSFTSYDFEKMEARNLKKAERQFKKTSEEVIKRDFEQISTEAIESKKILESRIADIENEFRQYKSVRDIPGKRYRNGRQIDLDINDELIRQVMLTDDLSRVSACKYYNPKTDKVLEQVFFNEHGNIDSIYKRIGDTNFVHNYTTKFCDVEKGLVNPSVPYSLALSSRYEYITFNNDNSVKHIEKFNPVTQDLINDITYQPLF